MAKNSERREYEVTVTEVNGDYRSEYTVLVMAYTQSEAVKSVRTDYRRENGRYHPEYNALKVTFTGRRV